MLAPEGCAARRARFWQALNDTCDALVITTPESLVYIFPRPSLDPCSSLSIGG